MLQFKSMQNAGVELYEWLCLVELTPAIFPKKEIGSQRMRLECSASATNPDDSQKVLRGQSVLNSLKVLTQYINFPQPTQ